MSSSAPSPWAFIRSRARSSRYFLSRSQLMRSCQSTPTMPKFAMSLLGGGVAPLPNLPPRIAPAKPARTRLYHTCRHSGLSTGPTISQNLRLSTQRIVGGGLDGPLRNLPQERSRRPSRRSNGAHFSGTGPTISQNLRLSTQRIVGGGLDGPLRNLPQERSRRPSRRSNGAHFSGTGPTISQNLRLSTQR